MIRPRFLLFFAAAMLLLIAVLLPQPRGVRAQPSDGREPSRPASPASSARSAPAAAHALLRESSAAGSKRGDATCLLYAEDFSSFAGPADVTAADLLVRWCLNGASIAGGGFCPTGGALRLDAASDAPRLLVRRIGAVCSEITVSFDYAQFAPAGTRVYIWPTNDIAVQCASAPGAVGTLLDVTGGICTPFSRTISLGGASGLYVHFDHGPNANAILIDSLRIEASACCGGGDCCQPGPPGVPGCGDPAAEACVCAVDPFCCEVEWDAICAAAAASLNCGDCGALACDQELSIDFGSVFQGGSVCTLFPEVFESCLGSGPFISSSTACGGAGDMVMRFGEGLPHSAAVTKCLDLSAMAAPKLAFKWTKNPGTLGPNVAVSVDGAPFEVIWAAPTAFAGGCANALIDLWPWARSSSVRLRFASGSSVQNGAAFDDIMVLPGGGPHDCCSVGTAGCDDPKVESCVCAFDAFCCESEWDELCVAQAEYFGCTNCGLCDSDWGSDFGSGFVPGSVCEAMAELFAECEGNGPYLGLSGACMARDDAAMVFISGDVPSAAITRCLDLTGDDQAVLRLHYGKQDGTFGPIVDVSADLGATWTTIWIAPSAPGPGCHGACMDLSPWTGLSFVTLRFRAGAAAAGGQVIDDVAVHMDESCGIFGDLDGDGVVGLSDLLVMLSAWETCSGSGGSGGAGGSQGCDADLDGDGVVGIADLLLLLSAWSG